MSNLNFWEIVGPAIVAIATIIALYGNSTKKYGAKNKITGLGWFSILLAVFGLAVTYISTDISKAEALNDNSNLMKRLNIIAVQNTQLLKSDVEKAQINDSLKNYIVMLKEGIMDATVKKIEEERNYHYESQQIILNNLISELTIIIGMIEEKPDEYLDSFKNSSVFLSGDLPSTELENSLRYRLDKRDKELVKLIIEQIRNANETTKKIKVTAGENRRINIDSLKRHYKRIKINCELLSDQIDTKYLKEDRK